MCWRSTQSMSLGGTLGDAIKTFEDVPGQTVIRSRATPLKKEGGHRRCCAAILRRAAPSSSRRGVGQADAA